MPKRRIKMINITICDGDDKDRKVTEEQCRLYANRYGGGINITVCAVGEAVLADEERIDILILGDTSEDVDTIKIKEVFEKQDRETYIIFISKDAPIDKMIGTNVSGFVRKPVEYDCLCMEIDKILYNKFRSENKILLMRKEGKELISTRDIVYVESAKPYIIMYYTDGKKQVLRMSLKKFLIKTEVLFAKAGRKYVVNLEHIKAVSEYAVLDNGMKIKLSKAARVELKNDLERYLLKKH